MRNYIQKLTESVKMFLGIVISVYGPYWWLGCKIYDENNIELTHVFKIDRLAKKLWRYKTIDGKMYLNNARDDVDYYIQKCNFRIDGLPPLHERIIPHFKYYWHGIIHIFKKVRL